VPRKDAIVQAPIAGGSGQTWRAIPRRKDVGRRTGIPFRSEGSDPVDQRSSPPGMRAPALSSARWSLSCVPVGAAVSMVMR
jgi:hypothetical protein